MVHSLIKCFGVSGYNWEVLARYHPIHTHTYIYIYIYRCYNIYIYMFMSVYIYICICICICICMYVVAHTSVSTAVFAYSLILYSILKHLIPIVTS